MMKYKNTLLIFIILLTVSNSIFSQKLIDSLVFTNGQELSIIGKLHNEKNYNRLPESYNGKVRPEVWSLSKNSAGISIRFFTNATVIGIKWTVMGDNNMPHMTAVGIKGVDLYGMMNNKWQFVSAGLPRAKSNALILLNNGDGIGREYLLNLPLYDGVDSLSIGINPGAAISYPVQPVLTTKKPIVYYGSSIAQGGVATRPGMAYTNILARHLDRSIINLGFSGQGTFDESVADAMAEADACLYIIDCNPNTQEDSVYEGALRVVKLLKMKKPSIPILLVEGFHYDTPEFTKNKNASVDKKRSELARAYQTLQKEGTKRLFYKKGDDLIGTDHEGTVDGVHPNDIGMMRMAQSLDPAIRAILHD
ncbi:MAG: SGNH/GDSL hydrolase family protein [Flavitalea sp.]